MFCAAQRLFLLICIFAIALFAVGCLSNKTQQFLQPQPPTQNPSAIDINEASADQLEKLPGIGKELAQRIIVHREKYGKFRRAEYLTLVKGVSDRKFRELREFIKAE